MVEIADPGDPILVHRQLDEIGRSHALRRRQHGKPFAPVQSRRDHVPVGAAVVVVEINTNFLPATAARCVQYVQADVVDQHGAHCVPVSGVEECRVATNGRRYIRRHDVGIGASLCAHDLQARAAPV